LINELDILVSVLLVYTGVYVCLLVILLAEFLLFLLFLFFGPLRPPELLFTNFLLRAYTKNFNRTVMRLNSEICLL
jgi:hypothetical protein